MQQRTWVHVHALIIMCTSPNCSTHLRETPGPTTGCVQACKHTQIPSAAMDGVPGKPKLRHKSLPEKAQPTSPNPKRDCEREREREREREEEGI
ncbi:unnamed protein product [Musa acuminata subsp. burmannicoides]